ncbi:MAG: chromosomal replication initiator protein DnaA, partial [candidate division NC10 bacterium]|nr:chromosomal replication initiator protein DnaA [candidate division NC10 bacterium]
MARIPSKEDLWEKTLARLSQTINRQSVETWLCPARILSFEEGVVQIGVPNRFFQEWIEEHYAKPLREAMEAILSTKVRLAFSSVDAPAGNATPERLEKKRDSRAGVRGEGTSSHLNPKYTFESFVVGSCNQFARAASLRVAEEPSKAYNPLFIYGGFGLGKTHLLHAIGNRALEGNPSLRVSYLSSEKFMNELINSIRYDSAAEFRNRYRSVDLLLVDDIQFIAGKERTQEEFFHTFNALHDAHKQIVISSDSLPKEIPTLEERLRSRFEWGLIADIQPPDLETKTAILRKKAEGEGIVLPDEVSLFIANRVKSSIRELEGCLVRIVAFSSLTGRKIDLELTQEILKELVDKEEKSISIADIQQVVAEYYSLKVSDLKSKNRNKS